ncbi:MAG: PepSY-like domain-containing protein [Duncaniella sp.]|nr:PepSY-like domain-containing protein [Duncaniella sp.]
MKKIYLFLMVCIFGCLAWSCSDDDDNDITISVSSLPTPAQQFISQFYPADKVARVTKEVKNSPLNSEYEVRFVSGQEVEFDAAGQWTDVDAPKGQTVPTGIVPAIDEYVGLNYDGKGINEISRDARGYEDELVDGTELLFDANGQFIGIDK